MLDIVTLSKYGGVFLALVLAGFGAPIPEEIPVVTAGAMVGNDAQEVEDYHHQHEVVDLVGSVAGGSTFLLYPERPSHLTRWWIMLPVCIVGVVLADSVLFFAGRIWGVRLLKSSWVQRRVLPVDKQQVIEANFQKYGIMILLGARFTPGIRTPVFIMAGVLKMPIYRFLLADALYAVPGVNLLFWLAYLFTDQFVAAINAVERHRHLAMVAVLAAIGGIVLYKLLVGRKLSTGGVDEIPPYIKPVGKITHTVEQTIERTVQKTVETAAKVVDKVTHPHGSVAKLPPLDGVPPPMVPDDPEPTPTSPVESPR